MATSIKRKGLPFAEKVFVVEIGNKSIKKKIESMIKKGGGTTSESLLPDDDPQLKNLTVISDHPNLPLYFDLRSRRRSSEGAGRATPSSTATRISSSTPIPPSKIEQIKHPETSRQMTLRSSGPSVPVKRTSMDSLQKVLLSLPCAVREAHRAGLRILSSQRFTNFAEKTMKECQLQMSPRKSILSSKVVTLKSPFLKCHELSGRYRPFFTEFEKPQWYPIYVGPGRSKSLFHKPEPMVDKSKRNEIAPKLMRRSPRKTTPRKLFGEEQEAKSGFCGLCEHRIRDMNKHLRSQEHRHKASDESIYIEVDEEISILNSQNLLGLQFDDSGSTAGNELTIETESKESSLLKDYSSPPASPVFG